MSNCWQFLSFEFIQVIQNFPSPPLFGLLRTRRLNHKITNYCTQVRLMICLYKHYTVIKVLRSKLFHFCYFTVTLHILWCRFTLYIVSSFQVSGLLKYTTSNILNNKTGLPRHLHKNSWIHSRKNYLFSFFAMFVSNYAIDVSKHATLPRDAAVQQF